MLGVAVVAADTTDKVLDYGKIGFVDKGLSILDTKGFVVLSVVSMKSKGKDISWKVV